MFELDRRGVRWVVVLGVIGLLVTLDPAAAFASMAEHAPSDQSDAYRSGRIAAYVVMGGIAAYYLVRWLRTRSGK
jgi:hypothetical protein